MSTAQNSLSQPLTINNQTVHTGVIGIDVSTYAIILNGRAVDVSYGTHGDALNLLDDWKRVCDVDLDTPFDELMEDDTYWRNGHVPRLVLDEPAKMSLAEQENEPQRSIVARITRADYTAVQYSDGTVEYFDNEQYSVTSSKAVA